MISKTIGFRGTQHFQTNPHIPTYLMVTAVTNPKEWKRWWFHPHDHLRFFSLSQAAWPGRLPSSLQSGPPGVPGVMMRHGEWGGSMKNGDLIWYELIYIDIHLIWIWYDVWCMMFAVWCMIWYRFDGQIMKQWDIRMDINGINTYRISNHILYYIYMCTVTVYIIHYSH